MSELAFHRNYSDNSDSAGFQFEFSCAHCGNAWRSPYERFVASTASSVLDTAGGLLGGIFGSASRITGEIRDQQYRSARDDAFKRASAQAQDHFHRCRRCTSYVCSECFNPNLNLCTSCAPSIEEEANTAARETEIELARAKAQAAVQSGKRQTDGNVVCPGCQSRVPQAKFCAECGQPLTLTGACRGCGTQLAPGAKFCPECGARQ
ncbi:MAG TPA: zinc ribbon domain-containing protein [Chloroflexota bacterium]|nr:zinc ribbon domain-containing protein [Chloroflexota bacterium]